MVGGALLAAARCRWLALAGMGGGAAGGGRSAADRGSGAGARATRSSRRPHRAGAACRLPAPRPSAARPGVKPGAKRKRPERAARCVRCLFWSFFFSRRRAGGGCCSVPLAGGSGGRALLAAPRFRRQRFFRRVMRQNAAGQRGQILHLTAYRPTGNGGLGSMPPYYPLLSPSSPLSAGSIVNGWPSCSIRARTACSI